MDSREAFEAWVQGRSVWKKYRNTGRPCSLRKNTVGGYLDYRVNDRWQAWQAALAWAAS